MAVDLAPSSQETQPEYDYDDERVHSGWFWLCILAIVAGSVAVVVSRAWSSRAGNLITLSAVDQTAVLRGSAISHFDPITLLPLATPETQPFEDVRHVLSEGPFDRMALFTAIDTVALGSKKTTLMSQYLVDAKTLAQLKGTTAWSYDGTNAADRSRAYAVMFPFDTGAGPYSLWVNEVDAPVTVTQQGPPFTNDGITVVRLQGHLDATSVDPLYIRQLGRAGIPASVTLKQLESTLEALGAGLDASMPQLLLRLTPADSVTLFRPIPLDYAMSGDISLLVEPRTGSIVSVEKSSQSYTMHLDASGLGGVMEVLSRHHDVAGVSVALAALQRLIGAPQTAAFDLQAAQTPASVKTLSDYAAQQRSSFDWLKTGVPTTLLVVGIVLVAIGVLAGVMAWRHRHDDLIE